MTPFFLGALHSAVGLSSIKGAFGFLSEFGHSFQNLNRILNGALRLPIQILNGGRLTATCRSRRGDRWMVLECTWSSTLRVAEFHDESFKANWRNTGTLKRTGCMSCSWLYSPSNSWLSRKVCRKSDRRPNQDARICALSSTFSLVVSASGNKSYCGVRGGQLTMYRSQSTCKCPCHPLSPGGIPCAGHGARGWRLQRSS